MVRIILDQSESKIAHVNNDEIKIYDRSTHGVHSKFSWDGNLLEQGSPLSFNSNGKYLLYRSLPHEVTAVDIEREQPVFSISVGGDSSMILSCYWGERISIIYHDQGRLFLEHFKEDNYQGYESSRKIPISRHLNPEQIYVEWAPSGRYFIAVTENEFFFLFWNEIKPLFMVSYADPIEKIFNASLAWHPLSNIFCFGVVYKEQATTDFHQLMALHQYIGYPYGTSGQINVKDFKRTIVEEPSSSTALLRDVYSAYGEELGVEDLPEDEIQALIVTKPPSRTIIFDVDDELIEKNLYTNQAFMY
ncbi:MAG: hypothetical protein ACTSRW_06760 [Candidatus Helarchaeota archaeon]